MNDRKIGRKIKVEIFEMGYHTQTHETGLYKFCLDGRPITDPFKDCINTVMVKEVLLGTQEGFKYVRSAFKSSKADFIIVKINKPKTQKLIITREDYRKYARRSK